MKKERGALDRVLTALSHPLRRRILRSLLESPGSASRLAKAFGIDLGVVSYHLNQVLAKQCGVVELVDTVPRRGSVEKIYGPRLEQPADLPAAGEPGSREEALWTMTLAARLLEAAQAEKAGS